MARIAAELLVALFAVFGLYAAVRFVCLTFFTPRELVRALHVTREMTVDEVVSLVWRAREGRFDTADTLVALLPSSLRGGETLAALVSLGVTCYLIDEEKGGDTLVKDAENGGAY